MGLYLGKKKVALVFKKEVSGSDAGGVVATEDITLTPTTSQQVIKRSSGKYINQVTVEAIQTEEKTATENGEVTPTAGKFLTKVSVNVETPAPKLQAKAVTENGKVLPDEGFDGLSEVDVNVASSGGGVDRLQWKCDNVKSLYGEFQEYQGDNLDILAGLNTSKVENFNRTFYNNLNLVSVPSLDFSSATNIQYMCYQNSKLTTLPLLDVRNVKEMNSALYNCSSLTEVNLENTNNVENMSSTFSGCSKLTSLTLDVPNLTAMGTMCYRCSALTEIKLSNTNKVRGMINAFSGCSKLTTVSELDMISVTYMNDASGAFERCSKLTNLTVKNVRAKLQIGSGSTWGHLLTDESLINTAKELWDLTGSTSLTLTVSTPSNARFDEIYVKLITATEEMIAEDENINNKKPCEVCESTDEGAMTLREYVVSKNWALA